MSAQRLENLKLAVESLREFSTEPIKSKRDVAGIVFGFVLAFELAWKCLQDRIAEMGYLERGPKATLSAALQAGLIKADEEPIWAEMLADRNLASHVYNQEFGEKLAERVVATHCRALDEMAARL